MAGIDAAGLRQLMRAIRAAEPAAQKALAAEIKRAVDATIVPDAQSRSSWSRRIPSSIRSTSNASGASVKAGGARAPHAAAFEHGGQPGTFRHPVFGRADAWAEQQGRPFLAPAGKAHDDALLDAVVVAIDRWVTAIGFR